MPTEFHVSSLIFDIGVGGFLGFISGYAAKLVVKIFLILAGVYIGSLLYLQQRGVISINQENLHNAIPFDLQMGSIIQSFAGLLPIGASFLGGFYLGFRRG